MNISKFETKAQILLDIAKFQDNINELFLLTESWKQTLKILTENKTLKLAIALIVQAMQVFYE